MDTAFRAVLISVLISGKTVHFDGIFLIYFLCTYFKKKERALFLVHLFVSCISEISFK